MINLRTARFLLLAAAFALAPAQAQTCSGTQDFAGPYGFTAFRLFYVPQAITPPGTTGLINIAQPVAAPGTTGQYSLTPMGQLVGGASNAAPFSAAGRVFADGAGQLYAAAGTTDAIPTLAGTYTVAPDCTIAITFEDAFAGTKFPPVRFQGVLQERGSEATLAQSTLGSGVLLRLERPLLANGCSNLSLSGAYGLSGAGVEASGASPGTPLIVAGRIVADGAGAFVTGAAVAGGGSLVGQPLTGTYTVNPDCTGVAALTLPGAAAAGTTHRFAFLLTPGGSAPGQVPRTEMRLVFTGSGQAGFAEAR